MSKFIALTRVLLKTGTQSSSNKKNKKTNKRNFSWHWF